LTIISFSDFFFGAFFGGTSLELELGFVVRLYPEEASIAGGAAVSPELDEPFDVIAWTVLL